MLDIVSDKTRQPDIKVLSSYVSNPLFDDICGRMKEDYNAASEIMYSGEQFLLGWNIRFFKSGRTLCRVYPREGGFKVLLVVGKREKERVEEQLTQMSAEMQKLYASTGEAMGQRWLILEFFGEHGRLYDDLMTLVSIRRSAK